ncbi:aminodeoxychorismate synthase component I [Cellvibrio sp.]|uniref:aminodeoxychorismate synthase component I n=1 Tax=Cellvibrio sp. TaxID=1965322 RepID=UPI00396485A6
MHTARLIPVSYREKSSDWFTQIRHLPMPIWLDSCYPQSSYGRFDILCAAPAVKIITCGDKTTVYSPAGETTSCDAPFEILQTCLTRNANTLTEVPFCGGALGYFAYDLGRRLEDIPSLAKRDVELPDMCVGIYPWAIIQDHHEKKAWLVVNNALAPAYNFFDIEQICKTASEMGVFHDLKQNDNSDEKPFKINRFKANLNVDECRQSIAKIKHYIAAGDCYQVNFAQRFSSEYEGDQYQAYLKLRESLPSPFSAYMEFEQGAVLSLSPERFVKLKQGQAETKPIKGTIARGRTPEEDKANASELEASLKNRAENLMIVDLLRNDLSKTCVDVRVPELFRLQSFANVHHLVSTVTGTLRDGATVIDLLANSFPGGSITGAPKIRAMEIIEELEPVRRSVYCGSIGYISACGNMDTNIAIRTLICDQQKIHCWGGGGIVADSDADNEYQESIAKVKVLLDTLENHFGN